jgi:hypothetical protein
MTSLKLTFDRRRSSPRLRAVAVDGPAQLQGTAHVVDADRDDLLRHRIEADGCAP